MWEVEQLKDTIEDTFDKLSSINLILFCNTLHWLIIGDWEISQKLQNDE